MEAVADVLESYRGRDRLVRTLGYSSRLLGGLLLATRNGGSGLQRGLLRLSQELSNCRATLRLFDDLAMLMFSREYGLGASEEDAAVRWLSVVANVTDQLYYPCEHLAWAADYKILSIYSNKWWTLSNILWSLSLALGVIRSLRVLQLLKRKLKRGRRGQVGTEFLFCFPYLRRNIIEPAISSCMDHKGFEQAELRTHYPSSKLGFSTSLPACHVPVAAAAAEL
ncbi:peroxisomal membrane protein 11C isoform X2 [Narcine bancroftii]|uniref:peroxisomal membrane protein 11C isoform X2 n=1 Tax=Narcine bancroftii TaxID=1343680 RepID=UPI0038320850